MVSFSRILVRKFFCKLLSKHLWRSLCVVKFHALSIFFWTPFDGCVWSMRIILWDTSYFRDSNNIHTARAFYENLRWNYKKNESCKWMNVSYCFSVRRDCFCEPFFFFFLRAQSHAQVKLRVRKIGSVEVQLPRPDAIFLTWWVKPLIPSFPLKTKNIYFLILSCDMT